MRIKHTSKLFINDPFVCEGFSAVDTATEWGTRERVTNRSHGLTISGRLSRLASSSSTSTETRPLMVANQLVALVVSRLRNVGYDKDVGFHPGAGEGCLVSIIMTQNGEEIVGEPVSIVPRGRESLEQQAERKSPEAV